MKLFNNRFISTALLTTAVTTASVVLAAPARAFEFGTRFIRFSEDTTLEFEFLGGSGKYVSNGWLDFGVAKSG